MKICERKARHYSQNLNTNLVSEELRNCFRYSPMEIKALAAAGAT